MTSIAKKRRSVKRQKTLLTPPRYTIRKDSLDRRYAIDTRTGQRVSLFKAQEERKRRQKAKKTSQNILRNIPSKKSITPKVKRKRSLAAKKGWETRKATIKARSQAAKKGWAARKSKAKAEQVPFSSLTPLEQYVPSEVTLVSLKEPLVDRMARYPKVEQAAKDAFTRLQAEAWGNLDRELQGLAPPKLTPEQVFQANVRDIIARRIVNYRDADRVLEQLWEQLHGELPLRELYQLYFSPQVA